MTARDQHPPQFDAAIHFTQKFRFQASAALVNAQISSATLLSMLCCVTTATTAAPLCTAVRIRRVSIWGPPAQDLTPVTVSIEFTQFNTAGQVGNRPRVYSDTSVGATRVAAVSAKPEKNSAADMWQLRSQLTTGGASLLINGPVNSLVDIDLEYVVQNGETPPASVPTTGAVVGTVAVNEPDTGFLLKPVSYPLLP
jgi:hypothetical protein